MGKIKESYFGTSLNKKTGELVPKIPSEFDLSKALTIFKSEYPFLYSVPNMFLQAESKKLNSAYNKFFSGGGYPKFKSKKDKHQSLNCYQGGKFDSEYIYLSVYSESQIVKIIGTDLGLYKCEYCHSKLGCLRPILVKSGPVLSVPISVAVF